MSRNRIDDETQSEAEIASLLVSRILSGERQAENEMVERYHRGLLVMLKNRSKDPDLAADIAQETWRRVLEKIRAGDLRDSSKLAAFIIQIGKNLLTMSYRTGQRLQTDSEEVLVNTPDLSSSPEQQINTEQAATCVRSMLGELKKDRDRDILRRFYLDEESKESICLSYELSDLHFNRVLFRARQRFKEILENSLQT